MKTANGLVTMMNKPPFEDFHGPIDSPVSYVDFCVYQGRQTGKTHKLIMSIPNKPIFLLVHSKTWGKELIRLIKYYRPDYDVKNIKFTTLKTIDYDTRGFNKSPVWVDNAVLDLLQLQFISDINKQYGESK